MQTDGYVTAAKLKDAYLGVGIKQETLLKFFEQHNTEFAKEVRHSRAKGTFLRYITVCKHIREFLPHTYKREDIPLKELNLTFINDFEYFLRTVKRCRTNTVWGYMIVQKHIISIARNDGRLPFNSFAGYINSPESVCTFKDVSIKDKLYSSEFNRDFETRRAVCSIKEDENGKFDFKIDGVSHVSWFTKKMNEFRKAIGIPKQNRGIQL